MIVVHASVMALAFADPASEPRVLAARDTLRADPAWAAPEHWTVEVFSALRGLWLGGKLSDARVEQAVRLLTRAEVAVVTTRPLLPRLWELRHSLTGHDAAYVAAAEVLDCALVTTDARIARAAVARCPIHLVA